jgi:hypothetical protein
MPSGLTVWKASVHGQLTTLLWACGGTSCSKTAHFVVKKWKEGRKLDPTITFKGTPTPSDLKVFHWSPNLKDSPHQWQAWDQALTYGLLGDIPGPYYAPMLKHFYF